jgi:SET domain-containing protein
MEALRVKQTDRKGRGVFATRMMVAGTLIESCPVIVVPANERGHIDPTILYNYYFSWGTELADAAIALGYGSLYNHSYKPNAKYVKDLKGGVLEFVAVRDINAGEEITVNYGGSPDGCKPLWFEPINE